VKRITQRAEQIFEEEEEEKVPASEFQADGPEEPSIVRIESDESAEKV
jgi:hypothetical protein